MIDLTTHRAEQQYLGTLARLWVNLERPMIRQLKPLIGRQYLDAAKLLEQGVDDVVHAVDLQMFRMRSIFRKQYTRVISVSHEEAIKGLESAEDKAEKRAEMDANFQRAMSTYIKEKTAKNVTLVNKTTKNAIQKRITKGIEAGKTHKEIAKDIRKLKGITSNHRATMIARTETHGAFNFATDEAVRGTGMVYTKIWSAVMSARTRPAHLRANRQRRKQDQSFEVWGEHLMYPGDQSGGSAKNVINCRCALTYSRRIAEELTRRPKPIAIIPSLPISLPVEKPVVDAPTFSISTMADFESHGIINEAQLAVYNKHFGIKPKAFIDQYLKIDGFKAEGRVSSYLDEVIINGKAVPSGTVRLMGQAVNIKDGSKKINISREIRFKINRSTGKATREVYNGTFEIDDAFQGQGIGKTVWKKSHALHKALKIDEVVLTAGESNGGYAWSRYGFTPDVDSWKNLKHTIKGRVEKLADSVNPLIDKEQKKMLFKLLESDDPKTIWKIADLNIELEGQGKLSKNLLRRSNWDGALDYHDKASVDRLEKYIGLK